MKASLCRHRQTLLNFGWGRSAQLCSQVHLRERRYRAHLQRKDVQFTRGKSFDTFCPVGTLIVDGLDPFNLEVTTRVNGVVKQSGRTADMAFSVPFLIRYISNVMTLYPGDLIATGTPAGVSAMKDGDVVEVEIEGIGVLRNPVRGSNHAGSV